MTIVAGFRCVDGVIICSDSQYTSSDKQSRDKLISHAVGHSRVTFAMTGDEDYARTAIYDIHQELLVLAPEEHSIRSILDIVSTAVSKMSSGYEIHHDTADDNKPQFMVAISTKDEAVQLFSAREKAVPPVVDCTCLGSGGYLARYLDRAFGPVFRKRMEDTLLIAIYMLSAARRHDVYCGGGVQFCFLSQTNMSAAYLFEWGSEDDLISKLEGRFGGILEGIISSDENFAARLAEFSQGIAEIRNSLMDTSSGYQRLLRQVRSITQQGPPNPQSTTGAPSRPPPSPVSPEGSGES